MKYFVLLLALVVVVIGEETYTTKWDGIDLDEILKSDRLFNNYYKCLMDEGRCTPDASELKRNLPDALKTECSKCSEKQKQGTETVIKFLMTNKAKQWDALQAKYDPEHVYTNRYAKLVPN